MLREITWSERDGKALPWAGAAIQSLPNKVTKIISAISAPASCSLSRGV